MRSRAAAGVAKKSSESQGLGTWLPPSTTLPSLPFLPGPVSSLPPSSRPCAYLYPLQRASTGPLQRKKRRLINRRALDSSHRPCLSSPCKALSSEYMVRDFTFSPLTHTDIDRKEPSADATTSRQTWRVLRTLASSASIRRDDCAKQQWLH